MFILSAEQDACAPFSPIGLPLSPDSQIAISSGMRQIKGAPSSFADRSPPPLWNMSTCVPHVGHSYPLMFSMMPITGIPTLRRKSTDLRELTRATACGVVTISAPSGRRSCAIERGSSPVPGGRSTTRKSRAPQLVSLMNCLIAAILTPPRHTIARSDDGIRKPVERTLSFSE